MTCPRCSGMVVQHALYEPYCMQCGWVDHGEMPAITLDKETNARMPTKYKRRPCARCGVDVSFLRLRRFYHVWSEHQNEVAATG